MQQGQNALVSLAANLPANAPFNSPYAGEPAGMEDIRSLARPGRDGALSRQHQAKERLIGGDFARFESVAQKRYGLGQVFAANLGSQVVLVGCAQPGDRRTQLLRLLKQALLAKLWESRRTWKHLGRDPTHDSDPS